MPNLAKPVQIEAPELLSIEESKADQIKKTFEPMVRMLESFESAYNEILIQSESGIDENLTKKAKRVRLDIGKIRIAAEKNRVEQKAEYLRAGKAIDGVNNILKWAIVEKEEKLASIEKHFENLEKLRLQALQEEREAILSDYIEDAHERDLSSLDEDVFHALVSTKKKQYEDRLEAEARAEQERIAREEAARIERERIEAENKKLRAEAEVARLEVEKGRKEEAKKEAERKRIEAERMAKEQEEERKRQAELARIRAEAEAKLEAERKEKARIEAELKAKEDAEKARIEAKRVADLKLKREEEARIEMELAKGDKEKVTDLAKDLLELKGKYSFESATYKAMYEIVKAKIDQILNGMVNN